jgi:creatinine amidohydrolase
MRRFGLMQFKFATPLLLLLSVGTVVAQYPPWPPASQPPGANDPSKMRTRYFTSMTNIEVENYLQRNDLIYIPIGTVQAHGILPVDCEYVAAQAMAQKMAEQTDGLIFPYLQFTYPGEGGLGRGTVEISPSEGLHYLKAIAESLLRQGFKRQIYVTVNDPTAPETVSPLILEFFYHSKNPVLYIEGDTLLKKVDADPVKVMFGAYSIVGRLNDIPVNFTPDIPKHATDEGLRKLLHLRTSAGAKDGTVGFFQFEDEQETAITKPVTAAQRAEWAREGAEMIEAAIKQADMKKITQSLLDHDRFTREYLIPKFGKPLAVRIPVELA